MLHIWGKKEHFNELQVSCFGWEMKADIREYVQQCIVYQKK